MADILKTVPDRYRVTINLYIFGNRSPNENLLFYMFLLAIFVCRPNQAHLTRLIHINACFFITFGYSRFDKQILCILVD